MRIFHCDVHLDTGDVVPIVISAEDAMEAAILASKRYQRPPSPVYERLVIKHLRFIGFTRIDTWPVEEGAVSKESFSADVLSEG